MKLEYVILLANDMYILISSLQRFGAIGLKTKNLCDEKYALARCACIHLMTLSTCGPNFLGKIGCVVRADTKNLILCT